MFDNCPLDQPFLPFAQSHGYGAAAAACGAVVFDADLGVGRALVVQRGRMRLISRGPVWDAGVPEAARRAALRRFARWPGMTIVTPEQAMGGYGLIPLVTPMHHAVWDLTGDLRAGLDAKWRNHLSAAERKRFDLCRDRPGALEALLAAEAPQRVARGYRTLPAGFTRALPPEALRLWEWHHAGAVAASMCFVRHGATASYHMAWAGQAARDRAIHTLMLWRAAEALLAEGVRWLDLGSINTEAAPGLARFKLGTGAGVRRLGATLLVVPG
jgi:hypothetical protein